jgi:hypothetical protein
MVVLFLVAGALFFSHLTSRGQDQSAGLKHFNQAVLPILQRCVVCHSGPKPKGGLSLTTRALALKGGESGAALVPGKLDDSLLYDMVSSKEMPPSQPLAPGEIASLRKWIEDGAPWEGIVAPLKSSGTARRAGPDWWSLQKVSRPRPPRTAPDGWARNPIDSFILARLAALKLRPASNADRLTLIRRAAFDLIGLPPTPAEIDAFLNDRSPDAYERLIDRLLTSPHYGERWARHWLDVARFGESQGFERDKIRDNAWHYRDYVVNSLNADKPYGLFIKQQIAGDVLQPVTPEGIVATGFLVAGPWDEVGQTQQSLIMRKRVREEELEDIISAVSQTFLGLTVNCARCHDHKFDPIPQRDYYRLKAVFEGIRHGDRPIATPAEQKRRDQMVAGTKARIAALNKEIAAVEQLGRSAVLASEKKPVVSGIPQPISKWTFQTDTRDAVGSVHGTLVQPAALAKGRLRLDGKNAFLKTAPLTRDLHEKTLEAWVALDRLDQRGGGVMSVETLDGGVFDAIVFGERQPKRWLAGSNGYVRTFDLNGPAEAAKPGELIHTAIVYGPGDRITLYRNGTPYADPYVPKVAVPTFKAGRAHVLFGLRHTVAGNGFLAGALAEARLYDRALTATEVAASYKAGTVSVPLERILAALRPDQRQRRDNLLTELREQAHTLRMMPPLPLTYAANSGQAAPTFVLVRGDVDKKKERVSAGALSAVAAHPSDFGLSPDAPEGERRLKLAEWIASAENPLAARVLVNRVWHYHFGQGLVSTTSDLGFNGGRPSHPELLDWLATQFIASGGSLKMLHRTIMLSSTYRQSSRYSAEAAARDAGNRLLWRFAPRRLEGESMRDAMLAVSGQLNPRIGGPSFRPFIVKVFNSSFYELIDPLGPEFNRRTVYRINVNSAKSPLLDAFDCPDPSVKTPARAVTTTPLQALGLMNNSFVLRQARFLAARVRREAQNDLSEQVKLAYRLTLGRKPTGREQIRTMPLGKEHGIETVCWVLLNASEFLYIR